MSEDRKTLFDHLALLDTEQRNPATMHIDLCSPEEIARIINEQDMGVADAVRLKLPVIARAIEITADAFMSGGCLFYAGSGTSGRLGILDAAECPPTFGTPPEMVVGLIAGGKDAVFRAKEGAEDSMDAGADDFLKMEPTGNDVVCGLAASGRTPYVAGVLKAARETGCKTLLVCCVPASQLKPGFHADVIIDVPVGPEVIMGSTRMKSATAQKMVCNMISTGAMIRLGKVFENVMVDLQLTNQKLVERAKRIIMMFSGAGYETAGELLDKSDGHVKTALLMALGGLTADASRELLASCDGFVRRALIKLKDPK